MIIGTIKHMNKVFYKKLDENAKTPTYESINAAGADLYALTENDICINPGETVVIHTGIAMSIPYGYFGGIYARSGLSTKEGLRPANCVGVVDSDYRGEIMVPLHNDSMEPRFIKNGQRIAQLIVQPFATCRFNEVKELNESKRGTGGFGSTGE